MVRGGGEAAAAAETKAPGIFSPNSGVPTYLLTRIPTSPRMRRRPFAKKIEKPKRQKVFSSPFE